MGRYDFRLCLRTNFSVTHMSENQAHSTVNSAWTEEDTQVLMKPLLNCEKQVGDKRVSGHRVVKESFHLLINKDLLCSSPGHQEWRNKTDFLFVGTPLLSGQGAVQREKRIGNAVWCGKYEAGGKLWELKERVNESH